MRRIFLALAAGGLALAGCNSTDRGALVQDAARLGKTAVRSATNAQLAGRVTGQLAQTKGVDLTNLKVESAGGVVTLSGRIRTKDEKRKVLAAVKGIRGVESVVDKTTVGG